MFFENGVKNIQAAAYNGARTVYVHMQTWDFTSIITLLGINFDVEDDIA